MGATSVLQAYRKAGHRSVDGWLEPVAIDLISAIAAAQDQSGVTGGVCEIGIHHGRLFILLHLLGRELGAAYDLFEMQSENIDASGLGDKETFLKNLRRHGGDTARVVTKSRNSLELTPAEIRADAGPIRLFSVDGGHTADLTANDIALAEASLSPGGVLILDDFFNEQWPGVAEGAARYMNSGSSRLVPVCIGGNKFIFTNDRTLAARYREALHALSQHIIENQHAFGSPVTVVRVKKLSIAAWLASRSWWKAIRGTSVGRTLKTVARRVLTSQ